MSKTVKYLTEECKWPSERIHLFGFGQGGSVALELGMKWEFETSQRLGSSVSINGPLLSYPTPSKPYSMPILFAHRAKEDAVPASTLSVLKRGYTSVMETKFNGKSPMPSSKEHWEPVMRFWSENLGRRREEGLYEIMTGTA